MTSIDTLWLLSCLMIKHAVVDFPMQGPYQYLNKGTYGHPGGLLHASLHGGATTAILFLMLPITPVVAVILGIVDFCVHYHIDWVKMNLNKALGWGPTTHEQFWWLLGLDQLLHSLTYIGIVMYIINVL